MGAAADEDRRFWQTVLADGGGTTIPRWSASGERGVAAREVTVSADVVAGLTRLANELGAPLSSVILAAHAKVLAALSAEDEVVTGYTIEPGRVVPCRLSTAPRTWRELTGQTARAQAAVFAHADVIPEQLRQESGLPGPRFEAVLAPADDEPDPAGNGNGFRPTLADGLDEGTVLRVGIAGTRGGLVLRLRYRTEVLDAEAAARIGGYYQRALELIAQQPDAPHTAQTLLSDEEVRFQVDGLAGPRRPLPGLRFHELFEQRVRRQPDAVAAIHGGREWTYQQLNAHANRLARAIRARGVRREGVVAVVTERNLDWMAAVIAIFKAGAVYLPVEPRLPAERIAGMLTRAECALALTETGSSANLDAALAKVPGVSRLMIADAYAEGHAELDLAVPVGETQAAYIYFTSGSTGEPKGAMCEHAGMLNHLYAKIDDLRITDGQVVAQTAPQSFDISLWQLLAALLVGGRTLIVEQEVILDLPRLLDRLVSGRVGVLQVVPSYLDALVSSLEQHPRALPDLAVVSVTGEALKPELARRWFAVQPDIPLVNAYGLTETSDDTNHEILTHAPERVLLGHAVNNVRVYVVDENLRPVPLGAPGLIAFSGVCVGRGYVNDPERTRATFRADSYHEGERLYLGGDYGRWHPGGKLEFLGRRDNQVKIRGFRIEIGEIENALLTVPGVRDAAVVTSAAGANAQLVAFYTSPAALPADQLRARLATKLPDYMIPAAFHWRATMPTTTTGKVDRKVLTRLAAELETTEATSEVPATPTERRLAAAWAGVLGIPVAEISRHDNFFDRGGNSLSAVKLAVTLERTVSLADLARHPVLADLAAYMDGAAKRHGGLLQVLTEPEAEPVASLVCFPYAGGNAVNFQSMARQLRGSGIAVYAVELPGHDPSADDKPATLEQVVTRVVDEITRQNLPRILLWGHSAGTAFAMATAKKLAERGIDVQRVFLAAQLAGEAAQRRAAIDELTAREPGGVVAGLDPGLPDGARSLDQLDPGRAERIIAIYRHDCLTAHRYFAPLLQDPPSVKLSAPVTVVVAEDDPVTAEFRTGYADWGRLAEQVELHVLSGGGHYFLRTRPVEAAQVVLRFARPPQPATTPQTAQ